MKVCYDNGKDRSEFMYDAQRINDAAIIQAITDTGYDVKG